MKTYNGIIWVRNFSSGSKSDGNIAYFIDGHFNHYKIYRKGVRDINDAFFYPYHLKSVTVSGEVQKQNWIMVNSINYLDEVVNLPLIEKKYIFEKSDFPDLINSDGPILSIVEQKFINEDGVTNTRLWLKGHLGFGKNLYSKVNETALLFFFQGRISVRELFLLRNDELYLLEENLDNKVLYNPIFYSNKFDEDYLQKIACANQNFYSIREDMVLKNPYESVMKKLELFWINSHESQKNI